MFGLMIAQRALKIGSPAPLNGRNVLSGVYTVHAIGGGGAGYNLDAFDPGLDGARGSSGSYLQSNLYLAVRTLRQAVGAFTFGNGGTVNTAPAAGNQGGASAVRSPSLVVIVNALGGSGGSSTSGSPWSARPALDSPFPFDNTIGKGGDGAIGGSGGQAATPGNAGAIYLEKIA